MEVVFKRDVFEPEVHFQISEAKGEVDGKNILAKVAGNFFVPDGKSRNKRFYSKAVWEKVLGNTEIKKKMLEKRMLGTVGHEQKVDEQALLDGKISHIVTNLKIEGKNGLGEVLVLDTPAGKALNTLLRAGSKLFVSSRANGSYKGEKDGVPAVDPETYQFETFDFVFDPGFVEANPNLVESINNMLEGESDSQNNLNEEEENDMDPKIQELLKTQMEENAKLKSDLGNAMTEVEKLKNDNTVLTDENNHLKEEAQKHTDNSETVKAYEELGKPEEIKEKLDKLNTMEEGYKDLGSPEEVNNAFDKAESKLDKYQELGDVEDLKEKIENSEKKLKAYEELGEPDQIAETFDKVEAKMEIDEKAEIKDKVEALSKECNVPEDVIERLLKSDMSEEDIKKSFEDKKETEDITERFSKKNKNNDTNEDNKPPKKNPFDVSRAKRLVEQMS